MEIKTKTIYVTNDGKEFETEEECREYEKKHKPQIPKIPKMWNIKGIRTQDMWEAWIIYFTNEDEIEYYCNETLTENYFLQHKYYVYNAFTDSWNAIDFTKYSGLIETISQINKSIKSKCLLK